jgi:hypothetical protein
MGAGKLPIAVVVARTLRANERVDSLPGLAFSSKRAMMTSRGVERFSMVWPAA